MARLEPGRDVSSGMPGLGGSSCQPGALSGAASEPPGMEGAKQARRDLVSGMYYTQPIHKFLLKN